MADEAPSIGHRPKRFQRLLADRMRELFRAHAEAPLSVRLVALLQGFDGLATDAPPETPPGNPAGAPLRAL